MVRHLAAGLFAAALFTSSISLPASAETDPKTVRIFKVKCASCHGVDGKGDSEQGKKLGASDLTAAAVQKASDAQLKKSIVEGKKAAGKTEGMDPFKDKLSDEQIDALVAYVRTLK